MPVTVVVGGQFGSEGKGKVALDIARQQHAAAVVRTGGTNSGHTGIGDDGQTYALRQLPAASLAPSSFIVLPPGALIDIKIFLQEARLLGLGPERIKLDPMATVISDADKATEKRGGLVDAIGSTGSGTGAALQRRISRVEGGNPILASDCRELKSYLCETTALMRNLLKEGKLVVIEGTQGFGLSLLHGGYHPKATSRDTTAGTFVAEAGLSPLDVSDVVMVIRSFPIRVAGDSGPLPRETNWEKVATQAALPPHFNELTTATKKVRRVAEFDREIVQRAIAVNNPKTIVLNHMDYVDPEARNGRFTGAGRNFIERVEHEIGRSVDWLGTGPAGLVLRDRLSSLMAA